MPGRRNREAMATPIAVEQLVEGDHACLTFSDAEERLDIVSAFVQDGLDAGQKVLCLVDSILPDTLRKELIRRGVTVEPTVTFAAPDPTGRGRADGRSAGRLEIRGSEESWLLRGGFEAARMVDLIGTEVDAADRDGYTGLRLTGDMCWATRPVSGLDQLLTFERAVNDLFLDGRLTAICQYDRSSFDAVTLAVAANAHGRAVAAAIYHEDPVLRICRQHRPPGVRVAGELDFTRLEVLSHALGETLRLDRNPHLNLVGLSFLDAACAAVMLRSAQALSGDREMTVACGRNVARMLVMMGAERVPRLRLVTADG